MKGTFSPHKHHNKFKDVSFQSEVGVFFQNETHCNDFEEEFHHKDHGEDIIKNKEKTINFILL